MFLLDTNVLFAAMFQAHARHESVGGWLATLDRALVSRWGAHTVLVA